MNKDQSRAVPLVRDSIAVATIVLPSNAEPHETLAAEEIVRFVKLISNAELPIVGAHADTDSITQVLIGAAATEALPDLEVERAKGDRPNTIWPPDGFVLRADAGVVALAGVNPSGTLYAAYELLERLGCRWYWPGELGQIVPRRTTLALEAFETVQAPSLEDRLIYISGEQPSKSPMHNQDVTAETKAWQRRNRLSLRLDTSTQLRGCHDLTHCLDDDDDLEDPAVLDKVVRNRLDAIAAEPDRLWFGLGLPDSDCRVTESQAMSLSNPWSTEYHATDTNLRFINRVAAKLLEKYPGKKFAFLAYVNFMAPPIAVQPHPSLGPYIAPIESCRRHIAGSGECWDRDAVLQAIGQWCRLCDKVSIWDYEPNFLVDAGIPMPCVSRIRVELPMMHRLGVRGFFSQTQLSVMNTGPNMYIRAKLFWDVDADVDTLLNEYYADMFESSADAVRRYWDALSEMMHHGPGHAHEDEILKHVYPIEKIRPLERHVRDAEATADNDVVRRRVQAIRFSFDNLMLYLRMREAEDQGRFDTAAELGREMLDLHFRIEECNPIFYKIGDLDRGTEDGATLTGGWIRQNEARQQRIDGPLGRLVTLLPDVWQFRTDPHGEGTLFRWFDVDVDASHWDAIRTTRVWEVEGYEDKQGHAYDGVGWYRTSIELPDGTPGNSADSTQGASDRVLLNFGGVFGTMHIWVNGRFVTYRPFKDPWWRNPYNDTFDIDITEAIQRGRTNTIAIRVDNRQGLGGIFRRVFLWSPHARTK